MIMSEEFRKHADECRRMAAHTRDPESKAIWEGLAERWDRCAALQNNRDRYARPAAHGEKIRRERRPMFRHAS